MIVVYDTESPNGFVQEQMINQCAKELIAKLFKHNKIKTVKRDDGKYEHYINIDIIVPERID